MPTTRSLITVLALTGALAGCKPSENAPDAQGAELRRMSTCDDLRARMVDVVTEQLVQSRYGYRGAVMEDGGLGGAPTDDNASGGGGEGGGGDEGPTDYTGTNNQEEGVDEVDLVKTDGRHLFVAEDRALHVVKSWPIDETSKVATVELDGWAHGLFLAGDKAVVFQTIQAYDTGVGGVDGVKPGTSGDEPVGSDTPVDEGDAGTVSGGGSSGGSTGSGGTAETPPSDGGTDTGVVVDDPPSGGGGSVPDDQAAFSGTRVTIIDVSDPANPTIERSIDVEGWLADARMIDGHVYAVLNQYMEIPYEAWNLVWSAEADQALPPFPSWDAPEAEWDAAEDAARTVLKPRVEALVAGMELSDILPVWRTSPDAEPEVMYDCDDLYAPGVVTPLSMLSVTHLDPATGDFDATGLLSDGWTIYASQSSLYVAQSSQWWWGWDDDEAASQIHKFALNPTGEPTYVASGSVKGWMYDQFAMSEHDGHLRAVTTDFTNWWLRGASEEAPADPANNVYVLKDDGEGELEQVGHLGGIAPGERVMAVRMMGEKGYVVTFEQTDPLFTIDLSDPTAPAVVGELVMPGYSAYLHPVDENHLLAVGMAGNDQGWLNGLSINLFDVSDFAHPEIADQLELGSDDSGWAWSESLWDHHAFTYGRGVLTVPATLERWNEVDGTYEGFSGTVSVKATPGEDLVELGRVDHSDLVGQSECLYDRWYGWEGACGWDYGYWYAQVRRSVYVEDNLFTVSDYGVKVNDLNEPGTEKARVVFYPR